MEKREAAQQIRLRIECVNAITNDALEFGLQDKDQKVYPGERQADGLLVFECVVEVKRNDDAPNFLGRFVHGTPADRFLYLTWKHKANGQIEQRIKIKLGTIRWTQVEAALKAGRLEARIEGRRTGSVPLLGDGWQVVLG
ncbi:MAG: DUF5990 family protein [Chloroflexota bacterium]